MRLNTNDDLLSRLTLQSFGDGVAHVRVCSVAYTSSRDQRHAYPPYLNHMLCVRHVERIEQSNHCLSPHSVCVHRIALGLSRRGASPRRLLRFYRCFVTVVSVDHWDSRERFRRLRDQGRYDAHTPNVVSVRHVERIEQSNHCLSPHSVCVHRIALGLSSA
jgi:hypothetical protein